MSTNDPIKKHVPAIRLPYALDLAKRGLKVFPLSPNTKSPPPKGWQKLATTDEKTITAWWMESPDSNIGISSEGYVFLDHDPRHETEATKAFLNEKKPLLKHTFYVGTPSGGMHFYFSGSADGLKTGGFPPGIDVRADGAGYVVGPGSDIDGKPYRVHYNVAIKPLPDEIRAIIVQKKEPKKAPPKPRLVVDNTEDEDAAVGETWEYLGHLNPDAMPFKRQSLLPQPIAMRPRGRYRSVRERLDKRASNGLS
jgi:hypothetical protein